MGTTSDTLQQWLSLGDLELWQAASLWAGKAPKREFEGDPEIALAFEKLKRAIYEKRLIANLSSIERSFLTHQELMGGREVVTKSTKISVKNLRAFAGSPGQRAALFQEHGKPLSLCSLSIDTRLTKGSQHSDYKGNVTEFLVVVRAHSRLSNVRIYARLYGMESDWSDAVVYWAAADEELKIGEIAALRADEVLDIPLGSRDGDVNSPLVVLGKTFERANNYWPYLRVDLRAIADEGATEESLAILSPGYVFNGVLRTEMVPLSKKAVSLIELPSRQSQSDTARGKQR